MNRINKCVGVFLALLFSFFVSTSALAAHLSPTGYWKTRSDRTGHITGIVKIWQQGGKYYGKIVKIYRVDGQNPTARCVNCRGYYHNKPILGMVVLYGVSKHGQYYDHGSITDPKSGEVYKVRLTLFDNGHKLRVHGYVGIPLFGRTQIWLRIHTYKAKAKR